MANKIKQIEDYLQGLEKYFDTTIDDHSKRLLKSLTMLENSIIASLKDLKTSSGRIDSSKENLSIAQKIARQITLEFNQIYGAELIDVVNDYDGAIFQVKKYFDELEIGFKFREYDKIAIDILKNHAISTQASLATAGKERIMQSMYDSIYGGSSFQSLIETIRAEVTGLLDRRGRSLSRYAQVFAHDTLMSFFSKVSKAKADENDFDTFIYYGDTVRDSRDFCIQRAGRVYTSKQIESWQRLDWKGKRPGNIWIVRGGYHCRHHFVPVRREWLDGAQEIEVQKFRLTKEAGKV